MTSLPIVPVKVKASGSDTPVLTCLLRLGIKQNIYSHQLMEKLAVEGKKTSLSLTTLSEEAKKA